MFQDLRCIVIPAKAGIQTRIIIPAKAGIYICIVIPAKAGIYTILDPVSEHGMTIRGVVILNSLQYPHCIPAHAEQIKESLTLSNKNALIKTVDF